MKIFLKYIFILVAIICCQTVEAKDLKFIQVTDIHFNSTNAAKQNFEDLINDINNTKNLDFVAFTGDNIDVANSDMLKDFMTQAKGIKVPYYIVMGNHDCFRTGGLSKEQYRKIVNKNSWLKLKSFNYVFKKNGVVFIVLDGAKEIIPSANGYYRNETLAWLDNKLYKYKNNKVVILQHFSLIDVRPGSNHNLPNPDVYYDILSHHNNVIAIFTGHYHVPMENIKNGIYHITTGAASGDTPVYREIYLKETSKNNYDIYSQQIKISE